MISGIAHGFGGRLDLPVPIWLFAYSAGIAVIVSFVALAALWRTPKLQGRIRERPLPGWMQTALTGPVVDWTVRGISLLFFIVVTAAAVSGTTSSAANLAPVVVFVWFWVGVPFLSVLFGNVWATLSPWDTLARLFAIGEEPRREYPKAWGVWPAIVPIAVFLVLELVLLDGSRPRILAVAILAYTAVTLGGMARYGREAWNRSGEGFAVYFSLLGRIAPFARDPQGRVVVRPPLAGLPGLEPRPGLVAFVMTLIGSTSYDGFSGSSVWLSWTRELRGTGLVLARGGGMLAAILIASGAYALAMVAAAAASGARWHPLAVRFAHSLVPVAFAYAAAHYFSLLLLEGQVGISLLSDPFGAGWNLFGTATRDVNFRLLSANAIWYFQVAVIVAGHVGGVVLAHDRAIAEFPPERALRTQYALLAVMVLFTIGGLFILAGG